MSDRRPRQRTSIGWLAQETGVKVPTIRYYERIGLLPDPPRTEGDQRLYDAAARDRLAFIRHARLLGFTLTDIRDLLRMAGAPDAPCADAHEIAERHLDRVEERIAQLTALRDELARMTRAHAHGAAAECRVLQVLGDHGLCAADVH